MASLSSKTVSGNTTTYVITGENGATITVAVTANPGSGFTTTISTSAGVTQDAMQMLVFYLGQLTSTNLLP